MTFLCSKRIDIWLTISAFCFVTVLSQHVDTPHGPVDLRNIKEKMIQEDGKAAFSEFVGSNYDNNIMEGGNGTAKASVPVLFPWFTEALGIIVFYGLTRYFHFLPYTAIMFIIGTLIGIGSLKLHSNEDIKTPHLDQLTLSTLLWDRIDSDVLLLIFLPGLIFKDAYGLNIHLFKVASGQCMVFAFPMVLYGTTLIALVAYYVFPYDWPFDLCMTFGAILSATDPVAVSALLNEVGAPPRLKVHISGESLFNDGSSIVFYTIFSYRYLHQVKLDGEDVGLSKGFQLFFQEAFGGACIGLLFGLILVFVSHVLHRRLNVEENVVQVTATITVAYLCFYVAQMICHTSGVIAVVLCGITFKAFGEHLINDHALMESFWILVEHLLNTLLFTLGGVVWGTIIANDDSEKDRHFSARDWGYLVLLYFLIMLIRLHLMTGFFPIISRIGLRQTWNEALFMAYGGLRGAVGISLAIALDNKVFTETKDGSSVREHANILFGMVGGISFFTLVINGSTSARLLKRLGLTDSEEIRKQVLEQYKQKKKEYVVNKFIALLTQPRFHYVDFALVKEHVPILSDLTHQEFKKAIQVNKSKIPESDYVAPYVETVQKYFNDSQGVSFSQLKKDKSKVGVISPLDEPIMSRIDMLSQGDDASHILGEKAKELRLIFIDLLHHFLTVQVEKGELDVRGGFDSYIIFESLAIAANKVESGGLLTDYECSNNVTSSFVTRLKRAFNKRVQGYNLSHDKVRTRVLHAVAFMRVHELAQKRFVHEFGGENSVFLRAVRQVLIESKTQVELAHASLESLDIEVVSGIVSYLFCRILLNKQARHIEKVHREGFLKDREAHTLVEEIEHCLEEITAESKKDVVHSSGDIGESSQTSPLLATQESII